MKTICSIGIVSLFILMSSSFSLAAEEQASNPSQLTEQKAKILPNPLFFGNFECTWRFSTYSNSYSATFNISQGKDPTILKVLYKFQDKEEVELEGKIWKNDPNRIKINFPSGPVMFLELIGDTINARYEKGGLPPYDSKLSRK